MGEPGLKHQHIPKKILPISFSLLMFPPFFQDGFRIKEPLISQAAFFQQGLAPVPQGATKPGINWNTEPHLRPVYEFVGNVAAKHPAQQPLPLAVP